MRVEGGTVCKPETNSPNSIQNSGSSHFNPGARFIQTNETQVWSRSGSVSTAWGRSLGELWLAHERYLPETVEEWVEDEVNVANALSNLCVFAKLKRYLDRDSKNIANTKMYKYIPAILHYSGLKIEIGWSKTGFWSGSKGPLA